MAKLKYLYQYMQAFPEKSSDLVKDWAKGLAALKDRAAPGQIVEELGAVLRRRNEMQEDVEKLARFYEGNSSATEFVDSSREMYNCLCAELDALFAKFCRALEAENLTLTGGEIAALKRYRMPQHLASALEGIKKKHISTIPEDERLSIDVATTLHKELTLQGLISGLLEAFIFHFGQHSSKRIKSPNTAISWFGTDAQFAFFVLRLSQYMQRDERGCLVRQKAICEAFRMEKKKQINVIRPYIGKFRKGQRCRGYEQIKLIFDNLPI
jgi:hypothetical protein